MANPVRVEVVGDAASMNAELGAATKTLAVFGDTSTVAFGQYVTAAERATLASDKLAVALAKAPAGSAAATAALAGYERELISIQSQEEKAARGAEAMRARQVAAAREIGRSLTTYVTAPTLLIGAASVKMGADFENTLQQVVGLSGVAQSKISGLRDEVLKLAPAVGKSPEELAQALYFITSSGIPASRAMEVLRVSAEAAAAGLGDTQSVADAVTSAMNAYGPSALSAEHATDVLVATVRNGKGEADQFAGVIGNVAALASQLGVSFNDVGAALAAMTRLGTDAETSSTQLQRVFTSLLKTSPSAEKAFEGVGLTAEGLRQELADKGLLATLQTIQQAFGGNTTAMAKAFADARSLRGVLALVGNQAQATAQVFGDMSNTTGSLGTAFDAVSGDKAQKLNRALASLQVDMVKIGSVVAPVAVDVADAVAKIAGAFDELPGPIKDDLAIVVGLLAVGGPLLLATGAAAKGVKTIGDAFGAAAVEATASTTVIESDLAAIGASATGAAGKVGGLRTSLVGLRSLGSIVIPVVIAETVLQSGPYKASKSWLDKHLGPAAVLFESLPEVAGEGVQAVKNVYDYTAQQFDGGGGGPKTIDAAAAAKLLPLLKSGEIGPETIQKLKNRFASPALYQSYLAIARAYAGAAGAAGPTASDANSGGGYPAAMTTPTVKPLTANQKLERDLALHPDDLGLLQQKATYDRGQLARLDQLRAAGKITNAKYVEAYKEVASDLVSTLQTIGSVTEAAAQAAKDAADKARAASLKALDAAVPDKVSGSGPLSTRLFRGYSRTPSVPGHVHGVGAGIADYQTPELILLAQARDQAMNDQNGLLDDARRAKAAAEKALKSGRLSIQAQIDAWNVIGQANETLGDSTLKSGYHAASVIKLTAGIGFASLADRKAQEMRLAQAIAHGVPMADVGKAGQPVHVHTTVEIDGKKVAKTVTKHQIRSERNTVAQGTGRFPGRRA